MSACGVSQKSCPSYSVRALRSSIFSTISRKLSSVVAISLGSWRKLSHGGLAAGGEGFLFRLGIAAWLARQSRTRRFKSDCPRGICLFRQVRVVWVNAMDTLSTALLLGLLAGLAHSLGSLALQNRAFEKPMAPDGIAPPGHRLRRRGATLCVGLGVGPRRIAGFAHLAERALFFPRRGGLHGAGYFALQIEKPSLPAHRHVERFFARGDRAGSVHRQWRQRLFARLPDRPAKSPGGLQRLFQGEFQREKKACACWAFFVSSPCSARSRLGSGTSICPPRLWPCTG